MFINGNDLLSDILFVAKLRILLEDQLHFGQTLSRRTPHCHVRSADGMLTWLFALCPIHFYSSGFVLGTFSNVAPEVNCRTACWHWSHFHCHCFEARRERESDQSLLCEVSWTKSTMHVGDGYRSIKAHFYDHVHEKRFLCFWVSTNTELRDTAIKKIYSRVWSKQEEKGMKISFVESSTSVNAMLVLRTPKMFADQLTFLWDELPKIFRMVLAVPPLLLPPVFLDPIAGVVIKVCVPLTWPLALPTA